MRGGVRSDSAKRAMPFVAGAEVAAAAAEIVRLNCCVKERVAHPASVHPGSLQAVAGEENLAVAAARPALPRPHTSKREPSSARDARASTNAFEPAS